MPRIFVRVGQHMSIKFNTLTDGCPQKVRCGQVPNLNDGQGEDVPGMEGTHE